MGRTKNPNPCSEADCQKPVQALGFCWAHYSAFRKYESKINDPEDFWQFVKKELRIGEPNERARQNQLS